MGLVWLTRSAVAGLAGSGSNIGYLLNLKLANPAQAPAFAAQHPGTFTWQSIQSAINALIGIEQVAPGLGGRLIGLLALPGLGVLAGRRMTEQARRTGLLKAVGATPMTVAGVLLFEHIALALAAATAGLVAGSLIAPLLTGTGAGLAGAPGAPSISVPAVIIIAVIALTVATVSSLVPPSGPHAPAPSPPSLTRRACLPADHCSPLFRRACPCRFSWPCVSSHADRDALCSTPSASPSPSPALLPSSPAMPASQAPTSPSAT